MEVLNGVQKPADMIARGPHEYIEAEHKYREKPATFKEYPRAMWHDDGGYTEAVSKDNQTALEAQGWSSKPFPVKVPQAVQAQGTDLALILLQQQQEMNKLKELVESQNKVIQASMANVQPPVVIPDVPKHGGRPKMYPLAMLHAEDGEHEVNSKSEKDVLEAKGWKVKE